MATRTQDALRRAQMERTVQQAIDDFIDAKQAENLSAKTLSWYRWLLEKFAASLDDPHLRALTLAQARAFVAQLQGRTARYEHHPISPRKEGGLSDYTIAAYVRTLKVFSAWLARGRLHQDGSLRPPEAPQGRRAGDRGAVRRRDRPHPGRHQPQHLHRGAHPRHRAAAPGHGHPGVGALRPDPGAHRPGRRGDQGAGQGQEGALRAVSGWAPSGPWCATSTSSGRLPTPGSCSCPRTARR